jgi:hypothetical protein
MKKDQKSGKKGSDDKKIADSIAGDAGVQAKKIEYEASELKKRGCDHCKNWKPPTTHDWYLECTKCNKIFRYWRCSCDGCAGDGPYQMVGGREYFEI